MGDVPVIGAPPPQGAFIRIDGHTLANGVLVVYQLNVAPFRVIAGRDGVQVEGQFPLVGRDGIRRLKQVLDRALVQAEKLASYAVGERQVPYTEQELAALEQTEHLVTTNIN